MRLLRLSGRNSIAMQYSWGTSKGKFDAEVYGLFMAESPDSGPLCPSKTTEPYPSSVARLCASRIKADPIPRF
ncbi:MAG: hypothetical protein ACLR6J_03150 [Parabacteroides merdae]